MEIDVTREPGGADFDAVQNGLDEYNVKTGPDATTTPLNVYVREDGALLGVPAADALDRGPESKRPPARRSRGPSASAVATSS